MIFASLVIASFGIDDEVVFAQKLVDYLRGAQHIAAAVLLKVEDKVLHPLFVELLHRVHELLVGICPETAYAYISHLWTYHIGCVDGVEGYLVAFHVEVKHLFDPSTHHSQMYHGASLASQPTHDFALVHLDAGYGCIVDADDAVACQDTHLL